LLCRDHRKNLQQPPPRWFLFCKEKITMQISDGRHLSA
jgi:hypothetical protein